MLGMLIMAMTYEEFKNTIERLRLYEFAAENPCKKSDYRAEILWLRAEYPEYNQRLKLEEMKE